MSKTLLVDLSNIIMTIRHAELPKDKKEDYGAELLFTQSLILMCDYARKYQVNNVILANEGKNVWRKDFYPEYKANRDHETDLYYPEINKSREWIIEFVEDYTNWSVITCDRAEGDDVIAIAVQNEPDAKFTIISSDTDFTQLLREGVTLYSPAQQKERDLPDDQGFALFLKCIRGDSGDNIRSAFPRIRETKLRSAWDADDNGYEMKNLMETVRQDSKKVSEVYKRNKKLIDLTQQPSDVREAVDEALKNRSGRNFDYMRCLRYLRGLELKEFGKEFDKLSDMLKLRH